MDDPDRDDEPRGLAERHAEARQAELAVVVAKAAAAMHTVAHSVAAARMSSLGRTAIRLLSHGVTSGSHHGNTQCIRHLRPTERVRAEAACDITIGMSANRAVITVNVATLERYTRTRRLSANACR